MSLAFYLPTDRLFSILTKEAQQSFILIKLKFEELLLDLQNQIDAIQQRVWKIIVLYQEKV